jgi:uncharacterized protein YkvS
LPTQLFLTGAVGPDNKVVVVGDIVRFATEQRGVVEDLGEEYVVLVAVEVDFEDVV